MWPTAFDAATYLQWFHPRRRAGSKTPYELLHKKKPDVAHLRAYGFTAYAKIVPIQAAGGKLNPRSVKAILVGYNGTAGYRLWVPTERKLIDSRNVVFEEGIGHCSLPPAGGDVDMAGRDPHVPIPISEPQADDANPEPADNPAAPVDVPDPVPPPPHCSARAHAPSGAVRGSLES